MSGQDELVNEVLRSPILISAIRSAVISSNTSTVFNTSTPGVTRTDEPTRLSNLSIPTSSTTGYNAVTPQNTIQELRQLFPTLSGRTSVKRKRPKRASDVFNAEVILLSTPNDKKTLKGSRKMAAYDTDFAKSSVEISRSLNAEEVHEFLRCLFALKLDGTDFEICVPMGGYIVKPNLNENQSLDGDTMYKLFNRKVIYLRPTKSLSADDELELHSSCLNLNNLNDTIENASNNNLTAPAAIALHEEEETSMSYQIDNFSNLDPVEEMFNPNSLQEIIELLRKGIDDDKVNSFNVYREDVYGCCKRAIQRKTFCPSYKISVCFTDSDGVTEGAIDAGGPIREMFRLALSEVRESKLFTGKDTEKYISFHKDSLQKNDYFIAGCIIALSLVHVGLPSRFFSPVLFNQIVGGTTELSINDITDIDIRNELEQAQNSKNLNELRTTIIEGTYIRLAGWSSTDNFEKKEVIIKDVINYYLYDRVINCIDQLREGFRTLQLLEYMEKFPEYFIEALCDCNTNVLSVTVFENLCHIDWSHDGSNYRRTESKIIAWWKDYLQDCYENDNGSADKVALEDILAFCTGSSTIPVFGFNNKITITFLHDEPLCSYPKANTCGLTMYLPIKHTTYDQFSADISFGFKNGMTFAFS